MNLPAQQAVHDVMESVIIKGDLSKLTPAERVKYYNAVCRSQGLNPLSQPLAYMNLSGRLVLYAKRDATDQLRKLHNVTVDEMTETLRDGVYVVTCKVRDGKGRTDISKGAVSIIGLKGDALANAYMKAETKAKRRATLSIVGLGFLDETEVESLPDAREVPIDLPVDLDDEPSGRTEPHMIPAQAEWKPWAVELVGHIRSAMSHDEIDRWIELNQDALNDLREVHPKMHASFVNAVEQHRNSLAHDVQQ